MRLRLQHGRKGQTTEYYQYDIPSPKFVTQRVGDYWIVGMIDTDKTWWFDGVQYPTATAGQAQARAYAETYDRAGKRPNV